MQDEQTTGQPGTASSSAIGALRVFRERWWIIALCTLVGAAAMLALSLTSAKEYEASSSVVVQPSQLTSLVNGQTPNIDPEREQATALLLVQSSAVAERVEQRLRSDPGEIDAVSEPDADLITITSVDTSPARAAEVANAFAEEFVGYRRDRDREQVTRGAETLRQQLAALPPTARASDRQILVDALGRVNALRAVTTGNASVVDRAEPPESASSPRPARDLMLGVILGLVVGLGVAFAIDLLDRRLKSIDVFEDLYGFPALTSIPERSREPSSQSERQAALEPFRILRNAIGLLGDDPRVVMVTSAVPGEGKSTTAAGLARAIALSGQRVVLLEADLRRPTFHHQFDLGGDQRGLTTALVGGVPVDGLLRHVLPGLRTLSVLPSGPVPPNAAELLRSPEFSLVIADLRRDADFIVVDAPPLLPVADAQVLLDSTSIDACIVVGRAYRTTREEARRTRAVLDRHRQRQLGLVVNGLRELDGGYEYYGSADDRGSAPRQMA